ncbi:unnamed protein product [Linum tenue]|uniref:Uncharacterized protein n=1 Tax=Linum tenue TaxID=586396 RepID=A0AAV0J325_9ROSI|nr:unnamed protein product [Linum tenue]
MSRSGSRRRRGCGTTWVGNPVRSNPRPREPRSDPLLDLPTLRPPPTASAH